MTDQALLIVRDKVQRYLTDLAGSVEIDGDGDFTLRQGSARVFVSCRDWGDGNVLIQLVVPLLRGLKPSAELFEHIATHANDYVFGHLSAIRKDDEVHIFLNHTMLGDFLDPEEMKHGIGIVLLAADEADDELKEKFGGQRFHED